MTSDEFRLLAISKVMDELGGVDLHARSCELNGGTEPKDSHYLAAVREGLDQIVREEFGEVHPSDVDRDSILEEAAKACERTRAISAFQYELGTACAAAVRALKSQPDNSPERT